MSLLSVKNLSISFQDNKIVDNISFNLDSKKITALVGESGSGKSVTSLAILGLLRGADVSGEIIFENKNLLKLSQKEFCKIRGKEIGTVFQDPNTSLNPLHKIGKQLAEAITIHNSKILKKDLKNRINQLLEMVELDFLKNRLSDFPHQISGGQKQRLMIAIALANNPKILIADEATTALDVTVQNEILNLLLRLKNELGLSILFITHNLRAVRKIADEILEMNQSKISEIVIPQQVRDDKDKVQDDKSRLQISPNCHPALVAGSKADNQILDVKDLSVIHKIKKSLFQKEDFYANRNINFSLNSGENLGIIGESGSGKSTLALALLNLISSTGKIEFFNQKNWQKNNLDLRRDVQVVFQDPFSSLNPRMTVKQIIEEGLIIHEKKLLENKKPTTNNQKLTTIMRKLYLHPNLTNRYPHQLSGGQRQRVAIARALILNPKILILDEPTSALDISTQEKILKILEEIQQSKEISYIIISHDLEVVARIADKIAVIKDGSIVELDKKRKVVSNPQNSYTKQLISNFN